MANATETTKGKVTPLSGSEKVGSKATEEQIIYSNLLNICMKIGLVAVILAFTIYVVGILPPKLAINDVIKNWGDAPKASSTVKAGAAESGSGGASAKSIAGEKAGSTEKTGHEKAKKNTPYDKLLAANGVKHGWGWVNLYGYSDFLNLFPIAFLASITALCYASIIPSLFKKNDTVYAVLAIIEVLILLGAASGIISAGAH